MGLCIVTYIIPTLFAYFLACHILYNIFIMQQHLDTEKTEWDKRSLLCPISLRRITEPVVLPHCEEVFDKLSVEEKIKG